VHAERRRGRTHSRILYWFRTPPGVKVGRAALDEDAIRRIEESNPSVDFDWTLILKGQTGPATDAKGPVRQARPRPTREARPARSAPAPVRPADAPEVPEAGPRVISEEAVRPWDEEESAADAEMEAQIGVATEALEGPAAPAEPVDTAGSESAPTAAHARLGAEGVLRLRARYAEVLARISERIADPARREELKAQAERLNPDTWVTADEVTAGIDEYERVFEEMRAAVGGGRKRRSRRGGPRAKSAPEENPPSRDDAADDVSDETE
jgi:hypothetical protein